MGFAPLYAILREMRKQAYEKKGQTVKIRPFCRLEDACYLLPNKSLSEAYQRNQTGTKEQYCPGDRDTPVLEIIKNE